CCLKPLGHLSVVDSSQGALCAPLRQFGSGHPALHPFGASGCAAVRFGILPSRQDCCLEPLGHLSELLRQLTAAANAHPIRSVPSPAPRAPCATARPAPRSRWRPGSARRAAAAARRDGGWTSAPVGWRRR